MMQGHTHIYTHAHTQLVNVTGPLWFLCNGALFRFCGHQNRMHIISSSQGSNVGPGVYWAPLSAFFFFFLSAVSAEASINCNFCGQVLILFFYLTYYFYAVVLMAQSSHFIFSQRQQGELAYDIDEFLISCSSQKLLATIAYHCTPGIIYCLLLSDAEMYCHGQ